MSDARGLACADLSCWFALLPHHFLFVMDILQPVINCFFNSTPFGDSSAAKQVHCWWYSLWVKQSLFNENNISELFIHGAFFLIFINEGADISLTTIC